MSSFVNPATVLRCNIRIESSEQQPLAGDFVSPGYSPCSNYRVADPRGFREAEVVRPVNALQSSWNWRRMLVKRDAQLLPAVAVLGTYFSILWSSSLVLLPCNLSAFAFINTVGAAAVCIAAIYIGLTVH